jgi:ATP-dependent RNA helicase DHX29
MAEHPQPEMLRLSLQDLALRIKIMKIGDSIEDVLLQALDPPAVINIQRAIASLIEVWPIEMSCFGGRVLTSFDCRLKH